MEAYRENGLTFRAAFETQNLVSVVAMVKAGLGITFTLIGIRSLFDMSVMRAVQIAPKGLFRGISFVRAKGRAMQQPDAVAHIAAL